MVWIHGGAFFSGSADLQLYHGEQLAAEGDVVVVTINYRLGAFGFLSSPMDTSAAKFYGNSGLWDQKKALEWVQTNIEWFGGNPAVSRTT